MTTKSTQAKTTQAKKLANLAEPSNRAGVRGDSTFRKWAAIVKVFLTDGYCTRTHLSRRTGQNMAAVERRIKQMRESGIVYIVARPTRKSELLGLGIRADEPPRPEAIRRRERRAMLAEEASDGKAS